MESNKEQEPGLKDYFLVLRKRFWLITVLFVITVTATAIYSYRATPVYKATTLLRIEKKIPKIIAIEDVTPVEVFRDEYYETQYKLIKSRRICSKAFERLNLDKIERYSGASDPVGNFCNDIVVTPIIDTYLVTVSFESKIPKLAANIANSVADDYVSEVRQEKRLISEEAENKLGEQIPILRRKLKESQDSLNLFEENSSALSFEKRREIIYINLSALNSQFTQVSQELAKIEARFKYVSEATSEEEILSLPDIVNNPVMQAYMKEIIELEGEKAKLLHTYKLESDPIKAIQKKIDLIENKITSEASRIIASIRNELDTKKAEKINIQALMDKQEELAKTFDMHMSKHTELKAEVEQNRKLYEDFVQREKELQSSSKFDFSTIQIVDRAEVPTKPVSPRKMLNIFIAAVISLLGGSALAFLLEYLDDSIKGNEDIEKYLKLPLLGIVPSAKLDKKDIKEKDLIAHRKPKSEVSEAYRSIRTSLLYASPNQKSKAYVVTSAGPQEGKTTTATNLAVAFAHSGKKVLLVDSDLRKPRLHKTFDMTSNTGLTNCLAGELKLESTTFKTEIDNLYLLSSGPIPPNPAELLGSPGMEELLDEMRAAFDIVIFDSPPLVAVTDAAVLSVLTDGAIQVVWAGNTSRKVAAHGKEKIEAAGGKLIGVILNNMQLSRSGYYYYYPRYYKYYGDQKKSSS